MEYYLIIKRNQRMPFAATWMDPEMITLSKVSQKDKYHIISHMWNLKYGANESIYDSET